MSEWNVCSIDELGSVNRGKSKHRPRNDVILFGGLYPFIQTSDVKNANLYISEYDTTYSEIGLAQSKLWKKGTLCITIAANIAESAILGIDACFPDSVVGFMPYEGKADLKFVKYMLDEFKVYMQQISKGTTQDNLSLEKLRRIKFYVPSYETQQKIAHILSRYDEAIENNNKRIKLLEQMAQNLYKEWFVRFRFPGYENCEFENGIPVGWHQLKLDDIADIIMGQSPESCYYNYEKKGLPFHQGCSNYGEFYLIDEIYSTKGSRFAEPGSIIFSVRAPVGKLNITFNKIILGRGVAAINSKTGKNAFLYWLLKNKFSKEDMIGNGSVFASVTKYELLQQKFLTPSEDIIDSFDLFANNIERMMRTLYKQNTNLVKQRDLLLPRLMSGKLEVD